MKIRELLDKPEKWTKEENARDSEGRPCYGRNPEAVCWCLNAALLLCYNDSDEQWEIAKRMSEHIGRKDWEFIIWNDEPNRTYEDVIKLVTELDI
jgi:hypothetical protein